MVENVNQNQETNQNWIWQVQDKKVFFVIWGFFQIDQVLEAFCLFSP